MFKKRLLLLLALPVLVKCQDKRQSIEIEQLKTEQQVVFRMKYNNDTEKHQVSIIQFPIVLTVYNNLNKETEIKKFSYLYNPLNKNLIHQSAKIYQIENNKLKEINPFFDKILVNNTPKKFLIYTRHALTDTVNYNYNYFKPYIDKMKERKIDSLLMGAINEFKKEHSKLTENLLSHDEIVLLFNKKVEEVIYPTGEKDSLFLQIKKPVKF